MAITDIQISEELETSAPSIKYRGDEGPKSPEEEMMMADALLKEEYEKYVYDLLEQRPEATPMSLDEFRRMVIGDMSRGPVLPSDEDPINPFGPKPTGPVLPDKSMMAEFSLKDYMDEFERVFPEMRDKRGTQEYMDMLEDYFRGLASKDRTSSRVQAASGGLAEILKV